ncbi:MAG: ABC transporter permease [Peptococcaceae bacterium]|jgi:ABC-2 type transport system permease protein|nr:ABC transporter permease [Peptococcaceae bacterium]MDH7523849.1 ABC transporter permease [Peptococcaceae bacterium]
MNSLFERFTFNLKTVSEANRGLLAVTRKEMADHLSQKRFFILALLITVACLASLYVAASTIRSSVGENQIDFVFLRLFTTSGDTLPFSFISFVSFLGPLVGITMGFDAINGERDRGTLSRVLSQPIYRDAVINGKFAAGVAVLALVIFGLVALVAGLGLVLIGIPPTVEEALRIVVYMLLSVVYIAFWLALSILFSVLFRQTSTSALAGVAAWLFLAIFAGLLAGMVAEGIYPVTESSSTQQVLAQAHLQQALARISPSTLYDEAITTLLDPGVRTLGPVLLEQTVGAVKGPLTIGQSLLLIWPHLVGLAAATLICFAFAYTVFMRQEIRA